MSDSALIVKIVELRAENEALKASRDSYRAMWVEVSKTLDEVVRPRAEAKVSRLAEALEQIAMKAEHEPSQFCIHCIVKFALRETEGGAKP